jgi:hypothetical protein
VSAGGGKIALASMGSSEPLSGGIAHLDGTTGKVAPRIAEGAGVG